MLFFQHCGGACGRVPETATAFAHRAAFANMMTGRAGHRAEDPAHTSRRRASTGRARALHARFLCQRPAARSDRKDINANYRGNYPRLVALKKKFDPTNLFRLNANVEPSGVA